MRDDVDDLLADLETALEVGPSPAVVTRVRANISDARARRGIHLQWAMAAGTLALIVAIGFVIRPGSAVPASPDAIPAPAVASAPPANTAPAIARASEPIERSTRIAAGSRVTPAAVEPEVLVTPGVAAALARLNQAVADGVIVSGPGAATVQHEPLRPTPLPLTPVTIQTIQIDSVAAPVSKEHRSS